MAAIIFASCGSPVELNQTSGDFAYSACSMALRSAEPAFNNDEYMIVQIFDSGKRNGNALKESFFFTYPTVSEGNVKPSSACKVDMKAKKITSLSYKNQDILDDVSEELRTF